MSTKAINGREAKECQRDFARRRPATCRLLLADDDCLTRLDSKQGLKHVRDQWTKIEKSVCARQHHDDRGTECPKVLLVLELAVNSEEDVEFVLCEPQSFAVAFAGPPHLWSGAHVVAHQVALEPTRHALVKQDAHWRGGRLSPAQARR